MKSTLYIGMGLALLSFMGFIAIVCMVGLLISAATDRGITWAAIKERLPTFLDLAGFPGSGGGARVRRDPEHAVLWCMRGMLSQSPASR